MADSLTIKVHIATKKYELDVDRNTDDEEITRKAASKVNTLVSEYSRYDVDEAPLDYLAMTALHLSKDNLKMSESNATEPFVEGIKKLTEKIENYLAKE